MVARYVPRSKYQRWHDALIERARTRDHTQMRYVEKHHIRPRCLGGTNAKSNLVFLTPEEHYVVHQLLVKIYPGNRGLIRAVIYLSGHGPHRARNNKLYGWLRRRYAESLRGNTHALGKRWTLSEETCAKIGNAHRGKIVSDSTRAKIAAGHTPERREAHRQRLLGNKQGLGNKSRTGLQGRIPTPEERAAIRQRMAGNQYTKGKKLRPRSIEHTERQRGSQLLTHERRRLGEPIFQAAGCLEGLVYG